MIKASILFSFLIFISCEDRSGKIDYEIIEKSLNLAYLDLTETICLSDKVNSHCVNGKRSFCESFLISDSLEINRINLKRLRLNDKAHNSIHKSKYEIDQSYLSLIIEPKWHTIKRLEDYQSDITGLCKLTISVPIIIENRAYSELTWSYTDSYVRVILIFEREAFNKPWYLVEKDFRT